MFVLQSFVASETPTGATDSVLIGNYFLPAAHQGTYLHYNFVACALFLQEPDEEHVV